MFFVSGSRGILHVFTPCGCLRLWAFFGIIFMIPILLEMYRIAATAVLGIFYMSDLEERRYKG